MSTLKKFDTLALIIVTSLIAVDAYLWFVIFSQGSVREAHEYFLDVGQGDSELIVLPGNIKIMTDAGPTSAVIDALQKVLPQGDRYIDIAIVSHPELDHFGGYLDVLDRYDVGAFVYNGRDGDTKEWWTLLTKIAAKHIPLITLGAGDVIRYSGVEIDLLSPDETFIRSAELNDTGLVELVKTDGFRTLLSADTGSNVEDYLLQDGTDLRADILKVPHHGSKYASDDAFLRAVDPKVAVIEVGAKNVYGHPSKEALARLASSTRAAIFRTDRDGTVEIFSRDGAIKIVKEKQ
ncbi:MAG: MBL fold metallo-hydrolase [Minisyncoccia bacterium]|jgi:beta-lactamase superfamily II metal-dependent hydrolase